jgi:NTE family protein
LIEHGVNVAHVDALVLGPSRDLGELASPTGGICRPGAIPAERPGRHKGAGSNLLSYLLFDRHYCRALMTLRHADAMARRDEIDAFSATTRASPIFPTAVSIGHCQNLTRSAFCSTMP